MSQEKTIEDIRKIHVVPYSHHDHAWTNTRQWHIWRYIDGFCMALDKMEENPEYRMTIDNVLHSLEVFGRYCPERVEEFKKRVAEGRMEVVNGGMALARPSLFDGELYLRNIVQGKKQLQERFGKEEIPVFFNADTAVGHSQMPQMLKLCGHEYYRFYRPETALDRQGIPRDIRWTGLDGSKILATRAIYGGAMYARWSELPMEDWEAVKKEFYDEDLQDKVPLATTDQLLINLGCDDVLPLRNLFDKEIDVPALMENWNKNENSTMEFSSFEAYHHAIEKQELPEWNGPLDPCELAYNPPMRADQSLWRKRVEGERLLVTLENLCVILSSMGGEYKGMPLQILWERMMEFAGHAMQWLLGEDYEEAAEKADTTLALIREELSTVRDQIAMRTARDSRVQHVAINPCAFERRENVTLHITSVLHVNGLVLRDAQGNVLEYQFTEVYNGDKAYEGKDFNEVKVTCNISVPAFGYTCILVEFDGKPVTETAKKQICAGDEKRFTIDNDVYEAEVLNGVIRKLVKKTDHSVLYESSRNDFGAVRLTHATPTESWTLQWDDIGVDTFVPHHTVYQEQGPVRFSYKAYGKIGQHPAELETIFIKGSPRITYRLTLENQGAEGYFSAVFPCNPDPKIVAGIPYGQEQRDTDTILYRDATLDAMDDFLYFERGLTGGFYANGFASYQAGNTRMALLQGNCNIYYRNIRKKEEIELVLMRALRHEERTEEWMTKTPCSISGEGIQHFEYVVSMIEEEAEAHRMTQELRYPIQTAVRYSIGQGSGDTEKSVLAISGGTLLSTAAYQEDGACILRFYESAGVAGKSRIRLDLPFETAELVDLCGKKLQDIKAEENEIEISYRAWEICTLRFM